MTAICKLAEVISDIEEAKPAHSAIEFIVENARPGEVIYIDDEDYYNHQLWRSYKGIFPPALRVVRPRNQPAGIEQD